MMTEQLLAQFDYTVLLPYLVPIVFALLILVWDLVMRGEDDKELFYLGFSGLAITGLSLLLLMNRTNPPFGKFLLLDRFAIMSGLIIVMAGILVVLMAPKYLRVEGLGASEFLVFLLCSTSGMLILTSATEFMTMFLGIELMALPLYLLTAYHHKLYRSTEAAMKYFLLGILASAFLLMSLSLLYALTGATDFNRVALELTKAGLMSNPTLVLAIVLLIVSFGFKISLFPFHIWTPDAYEGAPSPVTAFMSVAPKTAALAVMIRLFISVFQDVSGMWISMLAVMAACTMVFGNVVATVQKNVKRLLAYSTIAHVGYLMIGLVAYTAQPSATGLPDGISAIFFYLFGYAFANIGAFAVVIMLGKEAQTGDKLDDYTGLAYRHPFTAVAMTIFLLSLAGIPLTAGFVGKFYLFGAAISAGTKFLWLVILGLLTSVVSLYYYMRIVMKMYMHEPTAEPLTDISSGILAAITVCTLGVLALGVFPQLILTFIRKSVLVLLM